MKIIYLLLITSSLLFSSNIKSSVLNQKDIRYVKADLLQLRDKASINSKVIGYLKSDEGVTVIQEVTSKSLYNWVLTTRGYTSSNYLSKKILVSNIQEIILEKELKSGDDIKNNQYNNTNHQDYLKEIFGLD
ncbi:MAG TPA: SH3 domain-containing protein [Arcobacter sp.]|nr:SH3 domain-containing protein [Arcobacter sp.]